MCVCEWPKVRAEVDWRNQKNWLSLFLPDKVLYLACTRSYNFRYNKHTVVGSPGCEPALLVMSYLTAKRKPSMSHTEDLFVFWLLSKMRFWPRISEIYSCVCICDVGMDRSFASPHLGTRGGALQGVCGRLEFKIWIIEGIPRPLISRCVNENWFYVDLQASFFTNMTTLY